MEFTLLFDEDMPGLEDDFRGAQAKYCIAQFGHEMGKTVAFELPKAYVDASPTSKAAGALAGVHVKMHGTEDYNASSNIKSSAARVHMF
jgi:hypothetical protein